MRRNRLLVLVACGLTVGLVAPEPRPAPPVAEPHKPALQADAEGYYVPGYRFTLNGFRFTRFRLRPEALLSFAQAGIEQPVGCVESVIRAATVHLRCDYPQLGTVTIDGKFLTRLATTSLDTAVLSAVVTVRAASGEILYSARDSFVWLPGD